MISEVNRKLAELERAKILLRETNEALFNAFMWADTEQMHEEIQKGRWDGVRAIIEENEEFLGEQAREALEEL